MPASPRRRRPNSTLSLEAAFDQVARWKQEIEHPRGEGEDGAPLDPVIDYEIVITYIAPGGTRRQEVTEDQARKGRDGTPLPGEYEIDAVDSNGDSILPEPWKATEYDPDAVKDLAKGNGVEQHPAVQLFAAAAENARIDLRDMRFEVNAARKREKDARDELNTKIDEIGRLHREKAAEQIKRERAEAEMNLAIAQRAEALEALEFLQKEVEGWKPHIAMAVDHGMQKLGALVMGESASNEQTQPSEAQGEAPATASDQPDTVMGDDPPPPGAEDPRARTIETIQALILNDETMIMLVREGFITWSLARAVRWNFTHVDIGEEPNWNEVMPDEPGEPEAEAS